jgi:hypothetical protein
VTDASTPVPGEDEMCAQCGHPFNPHRLLGYGDPPTEGWMECPVEGCACRMTWSMAPTPGRDAGEATEPPSAP